MSGADAVLSDLQCARAALPHGSERNDPCADMGSVLTNAGLRHCWCEALHFSRDPAPVEDLRAPVNVIDTVGAKCLRCGFWCREVRYCWWQTLLLTECRFDPGIPSSPSETPYCWCQNASIKVEDRSKMGDTFMARSFLQAFVASQSFGVQRGDGSSSPPACATVSH